MSQKDWDPDDLLDFDYRRPVNREPVGTEQSRSRQDSSVDPQEKLRQERQRQQELREYEALRKQREEQAGEEPVSSRVAARKKAARQASRKKALDKVAGKLPKKSSKPSRPVRTDDTAAGGQIADVTVADSEAAALRKAQQEAYERYRSNYNRNTGKSSRKSAQPRKAGIFTRGLSLIYLAAVAVFAVIMTIIDVLPFGMLVALYAVLGLLSLIIVIQLRKGNISRWVRVLASVTAIVLIAFYGVGSAYAMGTLSFLDFTSVKNDKKVASVTRQPFNVCITGMDVRGTIDTEGRSDVNMLVTVNPKTEQILMTSIPRDYQIYMPDFDMAMDKLTHTGFYGVDTTIAAEENLFDTKINYYVKVNFSTVKRFIDAIGGIDVYSEYTFTPVKMKSWTVQEGMNHMNGKQALAFARERKAFPTGDNQRVKNQQAVFEAIIKKATSSRTMVLSYNKIISSLRDYFQMSISSAELRSLIKLQLAKNPDWKIFKNSVTGGDGSLPTYSTGGAYAYVMTQDPESIDKAKSLINGMLEGKKLDKDDDGNIYVAGEESKESGD